MGGDYRVKLCFYVPPSHVDAVKDAIFAVGAGALGNYEHCAWQVLGRGQFRPLAGSQPFVGRGGQLEVLDEYRVELVLPQALAVATVAALKQSHPYEEPAYELTPVWQDAEALVAALDRLSEG